MHCRKTCVKIIKYSLHSILFDIKMNYIRCTYAFLIYLLSNAHILPERLQTSGNADKGSIILLIKKQ